MELVCPAGNLPALKAAVNAGADAVYIGFQNATNARHFAGLNFTNTQIETGVAYAHERGCKVFIAVNTYPYSKQMPQWHSAVDAAADLGVDALILADMGVMAYAHKKHPDLNLHLSVQGSATTHQAVNFYAQSFGIKRAVIPRVLSVKQVAHLVKHSEVPIEVFGFGSLCVMVEGRCFLSSYATGLGPNNFGACSPASHVKWEQKDGHLATRLNDVLIDQVPDGESVGYPTICKGRYCVNNQTGYAIEEPTSLNTLAILPELKRLGVAAIKVEGRQRSPAYVKQVAAIMRAAIDQCERAGDDYQVKPQWQADLAELSEGQQTTLGAYYRKWQ
ncbi:ubiquinone anaerobic biosynthesis protein UbiU [Marinicella rhabdoformis]|uniref:ubiquinone anaerobic biosynthesis protein UbiU n=1 Tax=Marinicella rhabdoformis TaxID=2580566 RepID=UPI0012AED27C|nr:peptidase U32 family protein [Marinicella rhabdoformis]